MPTIPSPDAGEVIQVRRGGYTHIENTIFAEGLSARAIGILVIMLSKPPTWHFSAARLAREVTEGRDAILTAMRELRDVGFVHLHRVGGANPHSKYYVRDDLALPWPDGIGPRPDIPSTDLPQSENPTVESSTPLENTVLATPDVVITDLENTPAALALFAPPTATTPVMFAAFWRTYPRKIDRQGALKKYEGIAKRDGPGARDAIAAGVDAWARHWMVAGTEMQFIPHPTTWLSKRYWESSPPPIARRPQRLSVDEQLDALNLQYDERGDLIQ